MFLEPNDPRDTIPGDCSGYHQFRDAADDPYGSFEVVWLDELSEREAEPQEEGWYWAAGFPGCLWDGDLYGPFKTAEAAYRDAMNV